jgi:hypothetical protein
MRCILIFLRDKKMEIMNQSNNNPLRRTGRFHRTQAGNLAWIVLVFGIFGVLAAPCFADEMATCAPDFSSCLIPENVVLDLRFQAIAGDVVLLEPDLSISDVFRVFNNILDTGLGTGLGDVAFLYSSNDSVPLPDPSTFSANAVGILEQGSITAFNGNGTVYFLGAPEPSTWLLLGIALVPLARFARRRGRRDA